jgi:hypothetical protein
MTICKSFLMFGYLKWKLRVQKCGPVVMVISNGDVLYVCIMDLWNVPINSWHELPLKTKSDGQFSGL